ncbi:hypothetical protein [Terribacillus saccharophilus]|uniref:hypothetical protein n=1 Tax=Terribacillus saccharophilus TaxID=361277 RepID=UPI000BA6FD1D|nr:hypothetical protein [Terribacillus saccharophilus]PAF19738.1 hypothetical protein CHH51_01360 [Terribacillus saccharophilus]
MDYKFAYTLPDGDKGEKTVQEESLGKAVVKAATLIADFEDIKPEYVQLNLIAKGDFTSGKYYTCEGCQ